MTLVGVHGNASGLLTPADLDVLIVSRAEAVKLLSTGLASDVSRVRAINPAMLVIVRLHMAWWTMSVPRVISPSRYADWLVPDVRKFYDVGIRYFEFPNEPNLYLEGYGANWIGATFAAWWIAVRDKLKGRFPDAKWGYAGLSPSPIIPAVRGEAERGFALASRDAIEAADWLGVHCYWTDRTQMLHPDFGNGWRWYLSTFPGKPVYITEYSNPDSAVSSDEKGLQYRAWLSQVQGPIATFGFISSGETWVHESWAGTNIPAIVGSREQDEELMTPLSDILAKLKNDTPIAVVKTLATLLTVRDGFGVSLGTIPTGTVKLVYKKNMSFPWQFGDNRALIVPDGTVPAENIWMGSAGETLDFV